MPFPNPPRQSLGSERAGLLIAYLSEQLARKSMLWVRSSVVNLANYVQVLKTRQAIGLGSYIYHLSDSA